MSDEFLFRLYYASKVTDQYSPMEIGNILDACRRNNPPIDVTGVLFLGNNYFFQCLEGPRRNVNWIYKKILKDQRHTDVELLEFREVASRLFSDWSMKYVRSAQVVEKILKETGIKSFNPYELDSYTINAIAEAFSQHVEPEDAAPSARKATAEKKKSGMFGFFK